VLDVECWLFQFFGMNEGPYTQLPANLPVPVDDGACAHLPGMRLPDLDLLATSNRRVNLSRQAGLFVLYAYPMTGRPGVFLPTGWDAIPGARGCTPESCGFRDLHAEVRRLGAEVFGLSTQTSDYQREARDRLQLPFELLSDEGFALIDALSLPTFTVDSMRLARRLTLVCRSGVIEHVFYPIFPPDGHAAEVVAFFKSRRA
jgi:peroxiredoxin